MDFLSRRGCVYAAVDGPQGLRSSVPPVVDTGMRICVVRFHGRNKNGWESNVKAERCNYLYSEQEMVGWIEKIRAIGTHVDEVHLVMNTNQGVKNGRLMGDILVEGLKQRILLL